MPLAHTGPAWAFKKGTHCVQENTLKKLSSGSTLHYTHTIFPEYVCRLPTKNPASVFFKYCRKLVTRIQKQHIHTDKDKCFVFKGGKSRVKVWDKTDTLLCNCFFTPDGSMNIQSNQNDYLCIATHGCSYSVPYEQNQIGCSDGKMTACE